MRGNVACDKRVAVLQGIAPPVLLKRKINKTHHFGKSRMMGLKFWVNKNHLFSFNPYKVYARNSRSYHIYLLHTNTLHNSLNL